MDVGTFVRKCRDTEQFGPGSVEILVIFHLKWASVEKRRYDKISVLSRFSAKRHTVDGQMANIRSVPTSMILPCLLSIMRSHRFLAF